MLYLAEPYSSGLVNGGSMGLILGFFISEKWRQNAEFENSRLQEFATTDPLTGLGNRRLMDSELYRRLAIHRRYGTPFTVMIFDVDHFKSINDVHGHDVGDRVLQSLAKTISATLRDVDILFRQGGEEFLAILPDTTIDRAVIAAARVREAVTGMVIASQDRLLKVTISQGLAEVQPSEASDSLIKRADQALYAAKRGGRDAFFVDLGQPGVEPVPGELVSPATEQSTTPPAKQQSAW
jgi:diguanylate cyclase (GGDEF)-like protein